MFHMNLQVQQYSSDLCPFFNNFLQKGFSSQVIDHIVVQSKDNRMIGFYLETFIAEKISSQMKIETGKKPLNGFNNPIIK